MGFIPWDGITVGKDRIPWEKDRQSVLFYAPAPKTHGNFMVFLLKLYKKNQLRVTKGDTNGGRSRQQKAKMSKNFFPKIFTLFMRYFQKKITK